MGNSRSLLTVPLSYYPGDMVTAYVIINIIITEKYDSNIRDSCPCVFSPYGEIPDGIINCVLSYHNTASRLLENNILPPNELVLLDTHSP